MSRCGCGLCAPESASQCDPVAAWPAFASAVAARQALAYGNSFHLPPAALLPGFLVRREPPLAVVMVPATCAGCGAVLRIAFTFTRDGDAGRIATCIEAVQ